MKLVYFLQWEGAAISTIEPLHPDVKFVKATSAEHAAEELADADIFLVAGPYYPGAVAYAVNNNAPKLRWMHTSSIGTDKFDEGGIPNHLIFTNAAGQKGRTVGEHAMALLLGQVHALPQMERYRVANEWARDLLRHEVASVERKTLLLLGYGSIGQEVARKAKAFDLHVVALTRSGKGAPPADVVAPIEALSDWLPKADYVICSLPLAPETLHLMGPSQFAVMKSSAILVNVGRGPVIDHAALLEALREKQIAAACLDVFATEPLPLDDELWLLPNAIISPHVAGTGGPAAERLAELVSENINRFRNGHALINQMAIGSSSIRLNRLETNETGT